MTNPNKSNEAGGTMNDAMREAFEAWADTQFVDAKGFSFRHRYGNSYATDYLSNQWKGWQASVASTPQPQSVREYCIYCNNTGDIHRADGEYLGECEECKPKNEGERLFMAAVIDLALISKELELDPDEGGSVPILYKIRELKSKLSAAEQIKPQPVWEIQAEILERVANLLLVEVKDISKNSLFRSGVEICANRIKVRAQMLKDFQEDDKFPELGVLSLKDAATDGQVSEAQAVAWRYNQKIGIGGISVTYSEAPPEQNPYLTSQCTSVDPLYTNPTSALAIDTAAKMQAAEVCDSVYPEGSKLHLVAKGFAEKVRDIISLDGITALEELLFSAIREASQLDWERVRDMDAYDSVTSDIVNSLIGEKHEPI